MSNRVELTKRQRDFIYARAESLSEWTRQASPKFQIHHIRPVGWQVYQFNEHAEEYNSPYRLILLSEHEHHKIHPDVIDALRDYRNGDKKAFEKMFRKRRRLMEDGRKYWVHQWDDRFLRIAHQRTIDFMQRGNPWPLRRARWI